MIDVPEAESAAMDMVRKYGLDLRDTLQYLKPSEKS